MTHLLKANCVIDGLAELGFIDKKSWLPLNLYSDGAHICIPTAGGKEALICFELVRYGADLYLSKTRLQIISEKHQIDVSGIYEKCA